MMTRCAICHDQTDDGPTCGAEMCDVAWKLIEWAADEPNVIWYDREECPNCILCEAYAHPLSFAEMEHTDDCLHKRAAALLASRGTEDDDV